MGKRERIDERPGIRLKPLDFGQLKKDLELKHKRPLREEDVMSAALYPKVFDEFETFRQTFGPVDRLPTRVFLRGLLPAESCAVSVDLMEGIGGRGREGATCGNEWYPIQFLVWYRQNSV